MYGQPNEIIELKFPVTFPFNSAYYIILRL